MIQDIVMLVQAFYGLGKCLMFKCVVSDFGGQYNTTKI